MNTKKITISIPQELFEEINEYRPYLNFSKIFREAVVKKISDNKKFFEWAAAAKKEWPNIKIIKTS
jgi:metal-responsive CopG/Arc/MetJ family transcriptional regulator